MELATLDQSDAKATLFVRCHIGKYKGVFTPQSGKLLVWITWDVPVDVTNRWDSFFQYTKAVSYAYPTFPITTEQWEIRHERHRRDDGSVEYTAYETAPSDPESFYQRIIEQDALRDDTKLGVSVKSEFGEDLYAEFDIAGVRAAALNKLFCYRSIY